MSLRLLVAHSEIRHASGQDVDAGPQFPELVETAIAEQEVVITRRRKPLVRVLPLAQRFGGAAFSDTSDVVDAEVESLTNGVDPVT